jgi:hypothetical protein
MRAVFVMPNAGGGPFDQLWLQQVPAVVDALRGLGVEVQTEDTAALTRMDHETYARLRRFKPDFFTSPNFNYLLVAQPRGTTLMDLFGAPAVALWEDPLGALTLYVDVVLGYRLGEPPPAETGLDVLEAFRAMLGHPLLLHYSSDTAQCEAAAALGLVQPQRVRWYPPVVHSAFFAPASARSVGRSPELAFAGNVYPGVVRCSGFSTDAEYRALAERVCCAKLSDLSRSIWDLLCGELDTLSLATRNRLRLVPNTVQFWNYYVYLLWHAVNDRVRLGVLGGVRGPVTVFGLFNDAEAVDHIRRYANLRFGGHLHHLDELPLAYATSMINLCLGNGILYQGVPMKLIEIVASRGFPLVDEKPDLRLLFGSEVQAITFRTVDELNAKIDYYRDRPLERAEIVDALHDRIRGTCTYSALYASVLDRLSKGETGHAMRGHDPGPSIF